MTRSCLDQHRDRPLDQALECGKKLGAERAVDHTVIARQCHRHDADEGDGAAFALHRLPPRRPDRQDGGLRRIDDGGKLPHAVHAEIGDRGRAALIFRGGELLRAGARSHLLHLVGDDGQRLSLGLADHRRDQPALDRNRNPDVGMSETQDTVDRPHRVGRRHALQRRRPGLDDEVVDGELEQRIARAVLGRPGIRLLAQLEQRADLDIRGEIEVRDGLLGLDQPRGNRAPHGVEWHLLERNVAIERLDLVRRGPGRGRRR